MSYAKKYLTYFDEVYKISSVTRLLETPRMAYEFKGNNQVLVNTLTLSGNYDYSKSSGYTAGEVANAWVAYSLDMDRGLKIPIDAVDSDEARVTAAKIQDAYLREKFFPELDLYRFTKIYSLLNASAVSGTNIVEGTMTNDNIVDSLDAGIQLLNDAEVPKMNRIIYISETAYRRLKGSGEFFKIKDATTKSRILDRDVEVYDSHMLIPVPQTRFNTAATFGEGSNTTTGTDINFMILYVPAIMAIIKRNVLRIFNPEQNLDSDGYLMTARQYHGLNLFSKKVAGLYINKKAA